jgi:hypothetical protein
MIKAIVLERNIKLIEISKQTEILKKLPDFKENVYLFHRNDKWSQINEEFLNSFVELLK